jgi:uncharacterized RDD family membrane protein YckC
MNGVDDSTRPRPLNMRQTGFQIRTLMILIAPAAVALAAWILVPPWWQYHQSMKTLAG